MKKVFSVTMGKTRVEFSVWKVANGYEARINEMVVYRSQSYSACSEVISDSMDENDEINVFSYHGQVH